jgi:CheY-like chemotaxis protein
MSHELRTPLNAILGMASEMAQEISEEKIREKCGIIRDASYGLISSVNDILDFGQIEKGALALNLQPFSPSVILNRIAQTSERLAKAKGLQFEYENDITTGLELQGDANRLEQILNNVIGNASKFTQDGKIRLVVRHRIENGRAQVEIVVSDTGVGIAKQQLDAVFELFSQSTMDDKRKFGGFGIGLSIVKALVDLHQGQISLESEPGVGTTCIVQLSYDIVALGLPLSPNQKNAAPEGRHILIVEDNAMNQMVLKMMLKSRAEFTFAVAGNGQECLEMMAKENFDLILLDLQMPVMDGYEALSAIRGGALGPEHAEKPVIVITADATPESRERAFALGANEYMTKPVDKSTLFALIDKMGEWIRRAG